jgi:oligopeptidase B
LLSSDSALIEDMDVFEHYLVLYRRGDARQQIRVIPFNRASAYDVEFPEVVYAYAKERNPEYQSQTLRFTYSSPRTPPIVYDYHLARRTKEVRKITRVRNFEASLYRTERVWANGMNGPRVAISLFYRAPLTKNGRRPMLLTAYGSYGFSVDPQFWIPRLNLVDRGYIFGIIHVRGGQEMGRAWYDQGRMLNKKNSFTDFLNAVEYLQREKWSAPDRTVIRGGSAGGLLVGGAANMRADLFRAVIADVPFVDLLHTMLDPSLAFTTLEYEQWGNPNLPEHYAYLRSYSPYDNVRDQPYPAILATAGLTDPRVNYWEPAKWVARLRRHTKSPHPILLHVSMFAGHAGASGRYDYLREEALYQAFVLSQIGVFDSRIESVVPWVAAVQPPHESP